MKETYYFVWEIWLNAPSKGSVLVSYIDTEDPWALIIYEYVLFLVETFLAMI